MGFMVHGSGFTVLCVLLRVQVSGFRLQSSRCRVQGAGFRVQGSGCKVQNLEHSRLKGFGVRSLREYCTLTAFGQPARSFAFCDPCMDTSLTRNPHPPITPLRPYAQAYGRVLGGFDFL